MTAEPVPVPGIRAARTMAAALYVCQAGSAWEREHLLFRDYLRRHADARAAYARVKQAAAKTWSDDRIAYTEAKTDIILYLLGAAETWASRSRWTLSPTRVSSTPGELDAG